MKTISYGELEQILSDLVEAQIAICRILKVKLIVGDHVFFDYPIEGMLESIITVVHDDGTYGGEAIRKKGSSNPRFDCYERNRLIPCKIIKGKLRKKR